MDIIQVLGQRAINILYISLNGLFHLFVAAQQVDDPLDLFAVLRREYGQDLLPLLLLDGLALLIAVLRANGVEGRL